MAPRTLATFVVAILSSLATGQALACSATTPCINEILADPPQNQDASREYLEFRGPPNTALPANTYFVAVEGDFQTGRDQGSIDSIINMSGLTFGPNGFLVLMTQGNTYTIAPGGANVITSASNGFEGLPGGIWSDDDDLGTYERPSTSFFLVTSAVAPQLIDDIDDDDDGAPDAGGVYFNWTILDSVGIADNPAQDASYAEVNFRTGQDNEPGTIVIAGKPVYVARYGDSFGSAPTAWVGSGNLSGTNPNWFLNATVVFPLGLGGKPLNHIGTTNAWLNVAPEVNIDATATIAEDATLTYAGNLSITDTDSGGGVESVTVIITNGTLSLSGTTGLTFSAGDGTGDATMTFTGTVAAINAALNGAVFTPTAEFSGNATVQVVVDDLGNTGTPLMALTDDETQTITVTVVNDPPAVANQSFSIAEDAAIGAAVGTVAATDAENDTLTYSITDVQTTFAIDGATGAITTLETLDRETTPSYTLNVSVTDGNTPTAAVVTITVTDVNDNGPTIDPNQVFTIAENAPNGSSVSPGPVQADDADTGDTLTYSFTSPNPAFAIIGATGQIVVLNTQLIDFETTPTFTINVTVSDGTSSVSDDVTINVIDTPAGVNAPVVHDQLFTVPQNAPNGYSPGIVFAVDEDGDTLSFALAVPSTDFAINPTTGRITVIDNTNIPTSGQFLLSVVVSDGALTDTATMTINVIGPNAAPTLVNNQTFSVAETAANGATVGTVVASDPENDNITFSFTEATTVFAMSASGVITVIDASQLDFETTPTYEIEAQGTDGVNTVPGTVIINVTNSPEGAVPTVVSINRAGTNPTTTSPVLFTVTFSENVVGVDSGDFTVPTSGTVAGASVTTVNCTNATCTVTVGVTSGSGTVGLNLVDNDTILDTDLAPNALGGPGAGNGNFTGQVYDIDLTGGPPTPPTVTSVVRATGSPSAGPAVAFIVSFSEPVTGVNAADFQLTLTGNLTTPAIAAVTGSGSTYAVTVSTGTGIGTIRLDVVDDDSIIDDQSTPLGGVGTGNGAFATGEVYQIDTVNTIPLFSNGFENP